MPKYPFNPMVMTRDEAAREPMEPGKVIIVDKEDGTSEIMQDVSDSKRLVVKGESGPKGDSGGRASTRPVVVNGAAHAGGTTTQKAFVVFIDDDGYSTVKTKLLPIAQSKNAKFCAAVFITSLQTTTPAVLHWDDLHELVDTGLFEIASHSYSHPAATITSMSEEEVRHQIRDARLLFESNGISVPTFVNPGGNTNTLIRSITSREHIGAFGAGPGGGTPPGNNKIPFRTYNMYRHPFAGNTTLDTYKGFVDTAVANKEGVVFMLHSGDPASFTPLQEQNLKDIIDYIQSLGKDKIEIVFPSEAFERYGSVIDVGDANSTERRMIASDGRTDRFFDYVWKQMDDFNCTTLPSDPKFLPLTTYSCQVSTNKQDTPPDGNGIGILTINVPMGDPSYTKAFFHNRTNGLTYARRGTSAGWTAWVKYSMSVDEDKLVTSTVVPANSTFTKTVSGLTAMTLGPGVAVRAYPLFYIPDGIVFSASASGSYAIKIVFMNGTSASITIPEGNWRISKIL